jgi:hypothetical protein
LRYCPDCPEGDECELQTTPTLARTATGRLTNAKVDKAFRGYGMALRREGDPPIPGEPLMSMAEAKRITLELLRKQDNFNADALLTEGYVVVPIKPTVEMAFAAFKALGVPEPYPADGGGFLMAWAAALEAYLNPDEGV